MKRIILFTAIIALFIMGCDNPTWHYYCDDPCCNDPCCEDWTPPATPSGVYSVTGDQCVRIYWNPVIACDLAGYSVWRGYSETGYYYLIAETPSAYYVDRDVCNGETYYYAISAYDIWGNESDLSADMVFDTPRPEGYGERVYIVEEYPDDAGYDFSEYWVVPYDYPSADVYFGYDEMEGLYYMQAANSSTDLLIYGPTSELADVNWAPEEGWMSGANVELLPGYSYLVWTADNHFAHIRITYIGYNYINFDWAYQTDYGNPELIVDNNNPFEYNGKMRKIRHSVKFDKKIKTK
ncbi:hypothetical protein DRQ33_00195 [bacterium]|nr:MAG: hypothetical protein DRQ33_00195 [bacterium]